MSVTLEASVKKKKKKRERDKGSLGQSKRFMEDAEWVLNHTLSKDP